MSYCASGVRGQQWRQWWRWRKWRQQWQWRQRWQWRHGGGGDGEHDNSYGHRNAAVLSHESAMAYDTKTVLDRYKQTLDLPEGEADESTCPLMNGSLKLKALGCEPGGCQTCCLGVVEIVRRYNERCAHGNEDTNRGEGVKGTKPTEQS